MSKEDQSFQGTFRLNQTQQKMEYLEEILTSET